MKDKDLRVSISMMIMCNTNAIIEYGRRRSGLPSALVVMEHDNNRTKEYPYKHTT